MRVAATVALCATTAVLAAGQSTPTISSADVALAKASTYEVVSIKQLKGDPKSVRFEFLPDGFWMQGLTLESLIPDAYGVDRNRVSGWPGWAISARFDIMAKMDREMADALRKLPKEQQAAQRQLMLQSLLADRLKLKVHRATEVRTTYELVLAKGVPKLKEDNPATDRDANPWQEGVRPATDWTISDGKITGHAMPISILAEHLQDAVNSVIVDKTGLSGRYDVSLHWDPADKPDSTEPSIFTALEEQLGLHLKPVKTTVETVVIDHLEMPSEN